MDVEGTDDGCQALTCNSNKRQAGVGAGAGADADAEAEIKQQKCLEAEREQRWEQEEVGEGRHSFENKVGNEQ